jgi:hypothetical protein
VGGGGRWLLKPIAFIPIFPSSSYDVLSSPLFSSLLLSLPTHTSIDDSLSKNSISSAGASLIAESLTGHPRLKDLKYTILQSKAYRAVWGQTTWGTLELGRLRQQFARCLAWRHWGNTCSLVCIAPFPPLPPPPTHTYTHTILEAASGHCVLERGAHSCGGSHQVWGSQGIAVRMGARGPSNGRLYMTTVEDVQTRLLIRGLSRIVLFDASKVLLLVLPNIYLKLS